jgi:ABC-type sugar transport system ATPase subunit
MNIVSGELVEDGQLTVRLPGGSLPLPDRLAQAARRHSLSRVQVGVRPEHLAIDGGPVKARVKTVESLGHERHVISELESGEIVIVRRSAEDPLPGIESTVHLTARVEHLHLFDPVTSRRID